MCYRFSIHTCIYVKIYVLKAHGTRLEFLNLAEDSAQNSNNFFSPFSIFLCFSEILYGYMKIILKQSFPLGTQHCPSINMEKDFLKRIVLRWLASTHQTTLKSQYITLNWMMANEKTMKPLPIWKGAKSSFWLSPILTFLLVQPQKEEENRSTPANPFLLNTWTN